MWGLIDHISNVVNPRRRFILDSKWLSYHVNYRQCHWCACAQTCAITRKSNWYIFRPHGPRTGWRKYSSEIPSYLEANQLLWRNNPSGSWYPLEWPLKFCGAEGDFYFPTLQIAKIYTIPTPEFKRHWRNTPQTPGSRYRSAASAEPHLLIFWGFPKAAKSLMNHLRGSYPAPRGVHESKCGGAGEGCPVLWFPRHVRASGICRIMGWPSDSASEYHRIFLFGSHTQKRS